MLAHYVAGIRNLYCVKFVSGIENHLLAAVSKKSDVGLLGLDVHGGIIHYALRPYFVAEKSFPDTFMNFFCWRCLAG